MLSDGDQIRNLLGSYCRLIDAGDFEGLGRLFAEAILCTEDGTVIAAGARGAADLYAAMTQRHGGTPLTQHVVANTVLEPLTPESLRATSTYVVFQATDTLPLQPIVTGTYVDTFARTDDGWRFAERRFGLGRLGDLSQHLIAPPAPTEEAP
ncbi:MAG: nuclear transport factor 2 family protein [Marmoricola sp.]